VPESYLEITSFKEPSIPPPPPPVITTPTRVQGSWGIPSPLPATSPTGSYQTSSFGLPSPTSPARPSVAPQPRPPPPQKLAAGARGVAVENEDEWEDEWDDDDESTVGEVQDGSGYGSIQNGTSSGGVVVRRTESKSYSGGTVRKPFNRFSTFAKSGGDAFLFESLSIIVPESEKRAVIGETSEGVAWMMTITPFQCSIKSPKKETKFGGIKSFIAYQITPTFSNIQVSRRYKHFDWLQKRLDEKYSTIAVPPLPEKQIAGRFEDDFVNSRLKQLQLWLDRMCKHPVLAQSEVFHHFLTCTDEKKWTAGKRRAEKDEFLGGKFFLTVKAPVAAIDNKQADATLEKFSKFVKSMDDGIRHLYTVGEDNVKKHRGPFRKEFQKIGGSFLTLAASFKYDSRPAAEGLTRAVELTGQAYNDIGTMFAAQPQNDMFHLLEGLLEYRGLLSTFPDTLMVYKGAANKVQENASKLSAAEVQAIQSRADVITYAVLAEMEHFQKYRTGDFKEYIQTYLAGQIEFYSQVTRKLEETLRHFDHA